MAYNYNPIYIKSVKEKLAKISNTKLLAPSTKEFGKMINRNLTNNSLSKLKNLPDFSVCAIFHQLESIVKTETNGNLELEKLMDSYRYTCVYYNRSMKSFFRSKSPNNVLQKQFALLDYILYSDTSLDCKREKYWDEKWQTAIKNHADLRLLLLFALGILLNDKGKGKVTADPLTVIRSFIMDYVAKEDCGIYNNYEFYHTLVNRNYNLHDRIATIAILFNFCDVVRLSLSPELSNKVCENCVKINGLEVDSVSADGQENKLPVIWQNTCNDLEFWYFQPVGSAYYMTKCDFKKKEYTRYSIYTGSEFGENIGKVIHPIFIASIGTDNYTDCYTLVSWSVEYDRNGVAQQLRLTRIMPVGQTYDWAEEFSRIDLRRITEKHHYELFAKYFKRNSFGWQLSQKFTNAYPGTSYVYSKSLYSIACDHILVQDIVPNQESESGFDLVEGKYFRVNGNWTDPHLNLYSDIGILIIGVDQPKKPMKKFLALDYRLTYYPIVDDKIIYEEG